MCGEGLKQAERTVKGLRERRRGGGGGVEEELYLWSGTSVVLAVAASGTNTAEPSASLSLGYGPDTTPGFSGKTAP